MYNSPCSGPPVMRNKLTCQERRCLEVGKSYQASTGLTWSTHSSVPENANSTSREPKRGVKQFNLLTLNVCGVLTCPPKERQFIAAGLAAARNPLCLRQQLDWSPSLHFPLWPPQPQVSSPGSPPLLHPAGQLRLPRTCFEAHTQGRSCKNI